MMQILIDFFVKIGTALYDRWQVIQQAIGRGRAEGEVKAIKEAEKEEEKANSTKPETEGMEEDEWRRD